MKKKIRVAFVYKPCITLTKEKFFTVSYHFFMNALRRNDKIDVTYFSSGDSFDTTKLSGKYDIILLFENRNHCTPYELKNIKKTNIPVVVKVGDLHTSKLFDYKEHHEKFNISAYFGYQHSENFYKYYPHNYKFKTVIFGLEPSLYQNITTFSSRIDDRILNSGAIGNLNFISRFINKICNPEYALRHYKLRTMCNKLPFVDYTPTMEHEYIGDKYPLLLQKYKSSIAASSLNYTTKYLEIPAAGCISFMEVNNKNYAKTLGFEDNKTAIFINTKNYKKRFSEFIETHNDPKWEKIAKNGREYVMNNLNNDKAVDSLVDLFKELLF